MFWNSDLTITSSWYIAPCGHHGLSMGCNVSPRVHVCCVCIRGCALAQVQSFMHQKTASVLAHAHVLLKLVVTDFLQICIFSCCDCHDEEQICAEEEDGERNNGTRVDPWEVAAENVSPDQPGATIAHGRAHANAYTNAAGLIYHGSHKITHADARNNRSCSVSHNDIHIYLDIYIYLYIHIMYSDLWAALRAASILPWCVSLDSRCFGYVDIWIFGFWDQWILGFIDIVCVVLWCVYIWSLNIWYLNIAYLILW